MFTRWKARFQFEQMSPKTPNRAPNPKENIFVFRVLQRTIGCHVWKHATPNRAKAKSFVKAQHKSKNITLKKKRIKQMLKKSNPDGNKIWEMGRTWETASKQSSEQRL